MNSLMNPCRGIVTPFRSKCRTRTNKNAATRDAMANTKSNITKPPTKLGTDIQIVSASTVRACTTTVSLLAALLLFRAKLTSPGATTWITRLVLTSVISCAARLYTLGLTVISIVSRRLRTPRKSSNPSTDRGRPPMVAKLPLASASRSSFRLTVLYEPEWPGGGGGGKWTSSRLLWAGGVSILLIFSEVDWACGGGTMSCWFSE